MGLDNLDQNYYSKSFPGDNHPWGEYMHFGKKVRAIRFSGAEENVKDVAHFINSSITINEKNSNFLFQGRVVKPGMWITEDVEKPGSYDLVANPEFIKDFKKL